MVRLTIDSAIPLDCGTPGCDLSCGGGTAFSPIFRFMQDKDIDPVACVVLTDLCCDDFGDEPAYPVLWVSNMKGDAPWGEIVYMEGVND